MDPAAVEVKKDPGWCNWLMRHPDHVLVSLIYTNHWDEYYPAEQGGGASEFGNLMLQSPDPFSRFERKYSQHNL